MIRTKTVFVLGAGASKPYGYPLGWELLEKLKYPPDEVRYVVIESGIPNRRIEEFSQTLILANPVSIDTFLGRRPEWADLGKRMIAAYLIRCESEGNLRSKTDDWYQLLIDRLDDDFDALDFSNVTVVTFNYDRSLEACLVSSLVHLHGKSRDDVIDKVRGLKIIHVYGCLGNLSGLGPEDIPYSHELTVGAVIRAASGIRIIPDDRDDSAEFREARHALKFAKQIIFLGHSYYRDNMRRLGMPLSGDHSGIVTGSAYMLSDAERLRLSKAYGFSRVGAVEEVCVGFLRNNSEFLNLT